MLFTYIGIYFYQNVNTVNTLPEVLGFTTGLFQPEFQYHEDVTRSLTTLC